MKYDSEEYREFKQQRIAAGKLIDPATAEMTWIYAQVLDPYGVFDDLAEEEECIGRVYFVRAPNSDIWVDLGDLPEATLHKVWQLQEAGYYNADRRAERLLRCINKLEAQLKTAGQSFVSLERETKRANCASSLPDHRRPLPSCGGWRS